MIECLRVQRWIRSAHRISSNYWGGKLSRSLFGLCWNLVEFVGKLNRRNAWLSAKPFRDYVREERAQEVERKKTALHEIVKASSAQMPFLDRFLVNMDESCGYGRSNYGFTLRIRKRPWYMWLLRAVWILWLLLWIEFAIGSKRELEPQAYSITLRVLIASLLLGLGLYFWRLREERKEKGSPQDGD